MGTHPAAEPFSTGRRVSHNRLADWSSAHPAPFGLVPGIVVGVLWFGATFELNRVHSPNHGLDLVIGLSLVVGLLWGLVMYLQVSRGGTDARCPTPGRERA
ncbi:MAG: hypothetical protein ACLQPH_16490 [Acidimicrobiales bacterium]